MTGAIRLPGFISARLERDARELAAVRATIAVETTRSSGSVERSPLPAADWILALETIKDSCETRTTDQPGSRDYLEFLRGFIKKTANTP